MLLIVWASILSSMPAFSADPAESREFAPVVLEVLITDGLLTLDAHGVPLSEILLAIGKKAGFKPVFIGDFSKPISVSVNGEPVWQAVDQLTSEINRVVSYETTLEGGKPIVSRLWLLGDKSEQRVGGITRSEKINDQELHNSDGKVRGKALLRLASQGASVNVLAILIQALEDDKDPLVRTQAAMALGVLSDERAVPALEAAMWRDTHASVRIQSTQALGQVGGERAVLALGEILVNDENNVRQRIIAAWALEKQKTDQAQSFLDHAANDPDMQIRDAVLNPPLWGKKPASDLPYSGPDVIK